jgi:hypothetical protein
MADKELAKYISWYHNEYRKIVGLDDAVTTEIKVAKQFADKLQALVVRFSSIWRYDTEYLFRYHMPISRSNFIVETFTVKRNGIEQGKRSQMIYAMLYSVVGSKNEIKHKYACCGYTYESKDGEYRSGVIKYKQIQRLLKECTKAMQIVEEYLTMLLEHEIISISSEILYPNDTSKDNIKVYQKLQQRQAINLLMAHWINSASILDENVLENHVVSGYSNILFVEGWNDVFNAMIKAAADKFTIILPNIMRISVSDNQKPKELVGQKLVITTVAELQNMYSMDYSIWRELRVASFVGDLVINGITAGVPMLNDYFFIPTSTNLFDNAENREFINGVQVAEKVTTDLRDLRVEIDTTTPHNKRLADSIYKLQTGALRDNITGDVTIGMFVESVGRTWADLQSIISNQSAYATVGPMLDDKWMLRRYLFDTAYTLLTLHDRLGVMHGDLHLNNCTIFTKYNTYTEGTIPPKYAVPNPRIVYRIGDKFYLYPHYGRYSCVIDYSRAILFTPFCKDTSLQSKDPLLPQMGSYELERLLISQKGRVESLLQQVLPDFVETTKTDFDRMYHNDPMELIHAIDTADFLRFIQGLSRLFSSKHVSGVSQENKTMLQQLVQLLEDTLRTNLQQLYQKTPNRTSTSLRDIITTWFAEDEVTKKSHDEITTRKTANDPGTDYTVVDYLCSDNPLRYNARNKEDFPPMLQLEGVKDFIKTRDPTGLEGWLNYDKVLETNKEETEEVKAAATAAAQELLGNKTEPSVEQSEKDAKKNKKDKQDKQDKKDKTRKLVESSIPVNS